MILHCPECGVQHIDAPDERTPDWDNPPHRSHLCHACGWIWRPADVATDGVTDTKTHGKADMPNVKRVTAVGMLATQLAEAQKYVRNHHLEQCETCIEI